MIEESSHSNSTTSPQYEEIIQELSSLCTSALSSASLSASEPIDSGEKPCFSQGALGSHAFVWYSTWKMKRKAQSGNLEEDEKLLHCAKTVVMDCIERSTAGSTSLSVWTNPSFGSHILLTAIFHQLEQGEASYQQLDEVEDFLEACIDKLTVSGEFSCCCNVMDGLAGTLQGIFFIRRELQRPDWAKKEAVRIAIELLLQGRTNSEKRGDSSPAPLHWGDIHGEVDWTMSTGCAGILQTLLGLEINEWNEIEKKMPNALESLLKRTIHRLPAYGHVDYYSNSTSTNPSGWAMDGAAGHAILLLQSYVVLGSMDYLQQAQRLVHAVIVPWCSAYIKDSPTDPEDTILGLFDGVVGVCYCLWLSKERDIARKLINKAVNYCKGKMKTLSPIDLSLAYGVSGLIRLLQQVDSRNADEMEIPLLSSALFNFNLETQIPVNDSDHDSASLLKRKKKIEPNSTQRQLTMASLHTDSSCHRRRSSYQSISSRCPSDLDEDSHMSVSSFTFTEEKSRNNAFIQHSKKDKRRVVFFPRRGKGAHSVDSSSFSLKEEDEDAQGKKKEGSSGPAALDDSDASSSFSTSSHMETATLDEQANPHYLAKQDSDNEEYIDANVSLSLFPDFPDKEDDFGSNCDKCLGKISAPPIDRLSLFSRTRNGAIQIDSDSDSDSLDEPISHVTRTPSTSNRKALSSMGSKESDSCKDMSAHSRSSRRSLLQNSRPQLQMLQRSTSKRNNLLDTEDCESFPPPPSFVSGLEKHEEALCNCKSDTIKRDSANFAPAHSKSSLDESQDSSESYNDDEYDQNNTNGDDLAIGQADEMPNEKYLDALDVSSRATSHSAFSGYKPNATQRKTLMDEDCHGSFSFSTNQYPSARFLRQTSLKEAENESESDSMNDDDTAGDDDLAMGTPYDLPSAAYLDSLDVSTRTRAYDPMRNYNPAPVQKKTLMDEEDHQREIHDGTIEERTMRSLEEESNESGSESMYDDDDGFEKGHDLALGRPDDLPSAAYLDSLDISTRTRAYDPYTNYHPVPAQKKTLMDEEGHGSFKKQTIPSGLKDSSFQADAVNRNRSLSIDTNDEEFEKDDDLAIGLPNEQPNMAYLDTHDVSTRTRSYDPYMNYKPAALQQKTLMDEEEHGKLVPLKGDDEFRSMQSMHGETDLNEGPNAEYLAKQDSMTEVYFDYKSATTTMPVHNLLDEEDHCLAHSMAPGLSTDSSLVEEAEEDAKPNAEYLARQDSQQQVYYEFSSITTRMPPHQYAGGGTTNGGQSSIEEEIEAAIKEEAI